MKSIRMILLASLILSRLMQAQLYADIVITKDDMILNGKIIEDNKPLHIRFANYHGTFTINYNLIREIHRTGSFEDDIKILKDRGRSLTAEEASSNYEAGQKMLDEYKKATGGGGNGGASKDVSASLSAGAFCVKNFGRLSKVLPYRYGGILSAEIPVDILSSFFIDGMCMEAVYTYSERDDKSIYGGSLSAGPLWSAPVAGFVVLRFNAVAGCGWYRAGNGTTGSERSALKWDAAFNAGIMFSSGHAVFSTGARFDYVYDSSAPLYGGGMYLKAGYAF